MITDLCEIKEHYVRKEEFSFLKGVVNLTAGVSGIAVIVSVVAIVIAVMAVIS